MVLIDIITNEGLTDISEYNRGDIGSIIDDVIVRLNIFEIPIVLQGGIKSKCIGSSIIG